MSTETYPNVPLVAVPDERRKSRARQQERRRLRGYLETFFRRYADA